MKKKYLVLFMKKHFLVSLVSVVGMICFFSCGQQSIDVEKTIRNDFQTFVNENYDDPNSFVEIASLQSLDTICNKTVFAEEPLKIIKMVYDAGGLSDYEAQKYKNILASYKEDKTLILPYKMKVRCKDRDGNKFIKEYQAWYNSNAGKVVFEEQTPSLDMKKHLPQIYQDFYDLVGVAISYIANHNLK